MPPGWTLSALVPIGFPAEKPAPPPRRPLARLVTRVLGYHLLTQLLMDQTRPLKLPQGVLEQAHTMMRGWGDDRRAGGWLNKLEDRFTVAGPWSGTARS